MIRSASIMRRCPGRASPGRLSLVARYEPEHQLVHVAPAPVLAGFRRADERVPARVEVGCGVLARRVVATADVAALLAHPQVYPAHPEGEAFLAARDVLGQLEEADGVEMAARGGHGQETTPRG